VDQVLPSPAARVSTRRDAPSRLVWALRSAGLSNSTAAAEAITMSALSSCARFSSVRPRPSLPRSISTTASFCLTSAAKASSPSFSLSGLKAGLESTSFSSRSAADRRWLERMARRIWATSGTARSSFSTIDLPRKPVDPVIRIVFPARPSAIKASNSRLGGSPYRFGEPAPKMVTGSVVPVSLSPSEVDAVTAYQ